MGNRIIIIDGNSLINRAYYAMQRPMITREGIFTQGIFGFLNMLNKIMEDYSHEYMAVAWDMKSPTFRHKAYKDYKAGRKRMPMELAMELPIMKEILNYLGIKNLEMEGYEADDIIGSIARIAEEEGLSPLIITGDKDALQLCTKVTKVLITKRGISEFDLFDYDKMIERYDLTPTQFIDLKGLMGDKSDNIPGIPGVGEKTGIKLIKEFDSVANLVENYESIKNAKLREKVDEYRQQALMSRKLAEIDTHVPLDLEISSLKKRETDYKSLIEIYKKLEFNQFLKRLSSKDEFENNLDRKPLNINYKVVSINSTEQLESIKNIKNKEVLLKVLGDNNHIEKPDIYGIALVSEDYLFFVKGESQLISALIDILNKKDFEYIGHDLISDYYMLMSFGLESPKTSFDTAIAEYVLNSGKSSYELDVLSFEYIQKKITSQKEFYKNNGQLDLFGDTIVEYQDYCVEWCKSVSAIKSIQSNLLGVGRQLELCNKVEFPLVSILADMELSGIKTEKFVLNEIGDKITKELEILQKEIYEYSNGEFNINSPKQLGIILFEDLKLPVIKKTKSGYSTSADILEKLKGEHPIIDLILQYRTLSKINSTYVKGFEPLIGTDGKIHAHYQQTVAATGRLSCTEPNLQNIPVRYELGKQIRKAFVADEEELLIGADYSQIELRIMASLSEDDSLISAFNKGEDIHRTTAARVFELDYNEVTPLDRSKAKAVNFGVIYGMSGFGLSEELHITRKEADGYIKEYFNKHQAVKRFLDSQVEFCKENGFTETIFGRRRYINELTSSNYMTRQLGERLAMNSPIQGTAADIIKFAMIKVHNELKNKGLKSKLVLQIHDELIVCAPEEESEIVKKLLVENMENAVEIAVNLPCEMNSGKNWFELK